MDDSPQIQKFESTCVLKKRIVRGTVSVGGTKYFLHHSNQTQGAFVTDSVKNLVRILARRQYTFIP